MTRIHATFDGHVLHPEEASVLEPNRRHVLTVEDAPATVEPKNAPHPLAAIAAQATDLGVSDMAEHHDDYADQQRQRR
jgi:hypothetical protein